MPHGDKYRRLYLTLARAGAQPLPTSCNRCAGPPATAGPAALCDALAAVVPHSVARQRKYEFRDIPLGGDVSAALEKIAGGKPSVVFLDAEFDSFVSPGPEYWPRTKTVGRQRTEVPNDCFSTVRELGLLVAERVSGSDWRLTRSFLVNVDSRPYRGALRLRPPYPTFASVGLSAPVYGAFFDAARFDRVQKDRTAARVCGDPYIVNPSNEPAAWKVYDDATAFRRLTGDQFARLVALLASRAQDTVFVGKGKSDDYALYNTCAALGVPVAGLFGADRLFHHRFDIEVFNDRFRIHVRHATLEATYDYCNDTGVLGIPSRLRKAFEAAPAHNPVKDVWMTFVVAVWVVHAGWWAG